MQQHPERKLHPYTLGFSLAVREIAHGVQIPNAHHAAQEAFTREGYQEFVAGWLAAHDIDRQLEEAVA